MKAIKEKLRCFASGLLACCLALFPCGSFAYADVVGEEASDQVLGSCLTDEEVEEVLSDSGVFEASEVSGVSEASEASVASRAALASAEGAGSSRSAKNTVGLAGETQYETAAEEAVYAFDSSRYAIVASGISAVDALSATALAGALDCPILLTAQSYLPEATAEALDVLGVAEVIVVGGSFIVQDDVLRSIEELVGGSPVRLAGESLFDTQMEVFKYGADRGFWGTTAIVANGSKSFADALSVSPVAYKLKAPVFLADGDGLLPLESARALIGGGFNRVLAVGGEAVVSERCMGIAEAAAIMGGGSYGQAVRIAGETLYDTSAEVARWAVSEEILEWDGAAFATGKVPYDALAGSAVQGREGSVLLLIDDGYEAALDAALGNHGEISYVKFFGGEAVVKPALRKRIVDSLSLANISLEYQSYAITLDKLADLEVESSSAVGANRSKDEILEYLDPANFDFGSSRFYQFADLSQGYSGVSAEDLNDFIAACCVGSESRYGVVSALRGTGEAFVEASKAYGVNEVYLVAHAALESAWGCSTLAQGYDYDGNTAVGSKGELFPAGTYYNFYGIGAYDSSPLSGGRSMAVQQGWNSPEAAVKGAAKWLSANYINPTVSSASGSGQQNTLWKMKWDAKRAASSSSVWHQYATSVTWATGISEVMASFYRQANTQFECTGFKFVIPVFVEDEA